jgi:hypothetical protein
MSALSGRALAKSMAKASRERMASAEASADDVSTTLTFRLPVGLSDDFAAMCRSKDASVSQVLRGLMRRYLLACNGQTELSFDGEPFK